MEELLNKISKYVNNKKVKYAIMIDGEWGCGKTYFIKNKFVNNCENAIYISLYGISSLEQLNEKIYHEIIKSKYTTSKIVRFFKKIWKKSIICKVILAIPYLIIWLLKKIFILLRSLLWLITYNIVNLKFNINISKLKKTDFNGAIELFSKINNYILVFDDLERSIIPFNEVLGYISELVENRDTKCIIISNEQEIDQINKKNYELKILTAIQISNNNDKNDLNSIKNRVSELYDETNSYKKIKEKIIGQTYLFKPNIPEIYDSISSNYKDDEISPILNNVKEKIIKKMNYLNYHNIRTLKSFFEIFDEIFNHIYLEMNKYSNKRDAMYEEIAISTFCTCVCFKKGENIDKYLNGELTNVFLENVNGDECFGTNYFRVFDFIIEYIQTNEIVRSNCSETLEKYYEKEYNSFLVNDPLSELDQYWEKSELEITEILKKISNNIENKKYEYRLYSDIIFKISQLEAFGYKNFVMNTMLKKMKKNIKEDKVTEIYSSPFFNNDDVKRIYKLYYEDISKILEKNKKNKNINQNQTIMNNKNWGIELYNYAKNNYNTNDFYVDFDVEKISRNLKNSNNKNIYYFKYYLDKISSMGRYIKIDSKKIKKLEEQVEMLYNSEKDVMKKRALKLVLEKLSSMNSDIKMWNDLGR